MHRLLPLAAFVALTAVVAPAFAATPPEMLVQAAYATPDKAGALALVNAAAAQAAGALARNPRDRNAAIQKAIALGYHAKLTKSAGEAKAARAQFEALAAADPRDPQPPLALAAWHLETVHSVGAMLAGAVLGAKKSAGMAALQRALALNGGGGSALVPGYAATLSLITNPADLAGARRLAEAAAAAPAPSVEDRQAKANALRLLPALRAGDGAQAAKVANRLLPFGTFL